MEMTTASAESNYLSAPRQSSLNFSSYLRDGLTLRPFQAEMIQKNLNSPSPIIYNASEMGLGKTVEALAYANVRFSEIRSHSPRLLVVAPAALGPLWIDEATKWLLPNTVFAVVSYTKLVTDPEFKKQIQEYPWDGIVFDEFHKCRTMTAKTTYAAISLWNSAQMFVYLMSGTPLEYSAVDLYPTLAATVARLPYASQATRALCSDYKLFGDTFCYPVMNYHGGETKYREVRNDRLLCRILYDELKFFFRDTREEKLPELPELQLALVPIDISRQSAKELAAFDDFERYHALYQVGYEDAHTATVRRMLGMAKATCKGFLDYAENILEQGEPLVIMGYHKEVLAYLKAYFAGYSPVVCSGDETPVQKRQAEKDFQAGLSQCFIGNLSAAGVGITLTRSCNIIILECDWLPSVVDQAIRRILRIGQTRKATAHFITSQMEFDRHIMKSMVKIQQAIDKVI